VIAVGDAWQLEGHVRALQQLFAQRGLDQIALAEWREPWYRASVGAAVGSGGGLGAAHDPTRDCSGSTKLCRNPGRRPEAIVMRPLFGRVCALPAFRRS
jgi:hypothetical protein